MNTPTPNHREQAAKKLYCEYTGGRSIDALYGPSRAGCRAHILSVLSGTTVAKSKAGWNVFREAMFKLYGITGSCLADRESNLRAEANKLPVEAQ